LPAAGSAPGTFLGPLQDEAHADSLIGNDELELFYDSSSGAVGGRGNNNATAYSISTVPTVAGTFVTALASELNALDLSVLGAGARTATADGLTTGTIAGGPVLNFVTVTSGNANHIIVLPAPNPGTIVILKNGATGYELRTSAPATISINGGAEASAESAIAASTMVIAVCTSATTWQAFSLVGTTLAAVEAAAAA
jgi:hypothetical protein